MDVVASAAALVALVPAFACCAVLIALDSRGPVFFRQVRVGRNGVPFTMLKFRSMHVGAEHRKRFVAHLNLASGPLFKVARDPRTTRVGLFMRRWSIDELPQLINVLKGDMSLVGPRPALPEELALYEPEEFRRLTVPQGLTGLWQVSGRASLPREAWAGLDLWYVSHPSLTVDVLILAQTLRAVTTGVGAF